jgi:hypothetical protein
LGGCDSHLSKKRSTTMTTEQIDALVFKDQAGEYYLLPQAVLERGRVSAEARAAIEEQFPALQALGTAGDDVQGSVVPALVGGFVFGMGCAAVGIGIGSAIYGDNLGPLIRAYASRYGG